MATRFELSLPDWASESLAAAPALLDDEARMRWVIELSRTNFERDTGGPFAAAVFEEARGRVVSIKASTASSRGAARRRTPR